MKCPTCALLEAWKWLGHKLGFVNEHIILGFFYVVLIGIYALLLTPFQFFKRKVESTWKDFPSNPETVEDLNHMF